jgi:uncharacterized protein
MRLTDTQRHRIKMIGKKYGLKLIILHGSYATGRARPGSDLDIGILGREPLDDETILNIFSDVERVFGNNNERELDIKSLHRIDPLFRYHVAKDSQLIYGDITDYNEFRAYAFKLYHDSGDLFKLEALLTDKYQEHLNKKYGEKYA